MTKRRLKTGVAITAILLIVVSTASFLRWRNRQIQRLESHSTVVKTARGPVEAAVVGQGPAVLVLHGTLGGYCARSIRTASCGTLTPSPSTTGSRTPSSSR